MRPFYRALKCLFLSAIIAALFIRLGCASQPHNKFVVLYTSVDDIFARPIISRFEKKTGIEVRTVFDSEAVKTVGLANRILSEMKRPHADVFWNGEFSRTIFLKHKGALAPYRSASAKDIPDRYKDPEVYWTGYACRARVICYNPRRLANRKLTPPQSILELAQPKWKDRIAICDPMIGTAASWATALYLSMGAARADDFFKSLRGNGVKILPGNSVVADLVTKGIVDVGVTDIDDVFSRRSQSKNIDSVFPDQADGAIGTVVIPATVVMIKDAPHSAEARQLIDYLLSEDVELALAKSAGHMPVRSVGPSEERRLGLQLKRLRQMDVSFEQIGAQVHDVTLRLSKLLGL